MSALNQFRCVVCGDGADEDGAYFDSQFAGPICPECRRNTLWATAYLKKEGIDRPFCGGDVNQANHKRFTA